MELSKMNTNELNEVLFMTNKLADQMQAQAIDLNVTDANCGDVLDDAARDAKAFAAARNANKRYHSDYGATDEQKEITRGVRAWMERQRKRGSGRRK
jgi:hypothetical protein